MDCLKQSMTTGLFEKRSIQQIDFHHCNIDFDKKQSYVT